MPRAWSDAVKRCRRHPRPSVGKDGAKRWCSCRGASWRYRLGVPDPATGVIGKPQWSQAFPTKESADAHQLAVRQAIREKAFTADRGQTVEVYLRGWLATKEKAGRRTTTVTGYRRIVNTHLVPGLGQHRLGDLRQDHVQAMLDRLAKGLSADGSTERRPVEPGTLRNVRACLRAALADAVRQRLVAFNVAKLVTLPSVKRPAPVVVPADRLALFAAHTSDRPLAALWLTDAVYGLRRAELLGLRWCDVDQDSGLILIRQTLVEIEGTHPCPSCSTGHDRLLFGEPKSAAGERAYPLVPAIVRALTEHRRAQAVERALYGADYADHQLVFAQADGTPLRPGWVSDQFIKLVKASGAAAGLARVPSLKSLRSSAVTGLHEAGTPLEVVSKVTGHADTKVTADHYLGVTAERVRNEFAAIAARLAPERTDPLSDPRPRNRSGAVGAEEEVMPP